MVRRVAVILAGCGVHDGTEVHEGVLVLLALAQAGVEAVCFAPDLSITTVFDHATGDVRHGELRSVLSESARIARGAVTDLAAMDPGNVVAGIFPGGYGVTRTLSDYAVVGRRATVQPVVERAILGLYAAQKPMGFACTAPVLAARVLGHRHPMLTAGADPGTVGDVEAWGARHQRVGPRDVVVDRANKLVSTPAYTQAQGIEDVAEGINRMVRAVLEMT